MTASLVLAVQAAAGFADVASCKQLILLAFALAHTMHIISEQQLLKLGCQPSHCVLSCNGCAVQGKALVRCNNSHWARLH
jgi:RsiW-degrading membrane proteinase PrsW (M82 family)